VRQVGYCRSVPTPEPDETKRTRGAAGAVLLQAIASISTLLQMLVFAIVLGRADFDDYSVWITVTAFLVGLGQAVCVERVLVGRRSFDDGLAAARFVSLIVATAQVGVSVALGNLPLALCSLAILSYATWDFARFTSAPEAAAGFFKRDLATLVIQVLAVVALSVTAFPDRWLPLAWWGVGAVLWTTFVHRSLAGAGRLRDGIGSLWADRREAAPLLLDAALAGVVLVAALALARAQGGLGVASEARLALTLLGPVTVLGLAARRIVYRQAAQGRFGARTVAVFGVCVFVVFAVCFALLSLTRTPLYELVLPDFVGLSWSAVLGFSTNMGALMAVMLPAAYLRAEGRSRAVGASRLLATAAGLAVAWWLTPFDDPADVAWSVAAGSIAYAVAMWACLVGRLNRSLPVAAS